MDIPAATQEAIPVYGCYLIFICSRYKRAHATSSYGAYAPGVWLLLSHFYLF